MIQGRDYQCEAVSSLYGYFQAKPTGNPVIAMPTGTGKSVVIALFLHSVFYYYPRQRVMVLTHVKELIKQNFDKLLDAWPTAPAGVYSAGLKRRDTFQKIIFAGIASVAKRADEFGHVDLVLIDEAHLVGPGEATMYQKFLEALSKVNPALRIIGLTATPWRLGQGHIAGDPDSMFSDVCFDITGLHAFNRLLQEGYLCPLVPKATTAKLDTDGVHMRGGEFIASELQAAVDKHPVTVAALKEAVQLAGDRASWLVFCAGVEHAVHVADILTELGVECKAVHSKLDAAERDAAIADWKAGKLRAISNNNVMTTGIDHPALDCIVMLRPTASTVLWVQMLGRGTRPLYAPGYNLSTPQGRLDAIAASQKHDCLVLDFAGNTRRLGPINDPVIPRKKGEAAGEAPVRLCDVCGTYNHASATHCMMCGQEFPRHGPKVQATAGTEDLIKLETPVIEVFKVDHVTYARHTKVGKPPSVRVSYYCKLRKFNEFVLLEHPDNFSRRKAQEWWSRRDTGYPLPASVDALLAVADKLPAPTHLRVWVNQQYPTILALDFTGTAFQTQAPGIDWAPSVDVEALPYAPAPAAQAAAARPAYDLDDDDIPF